MNEIYQSLVAVNPITLIAQICNLFLQLYAVKKFFLGRILAILDQRREAADRQISDAQRAKDEAHQIKTACEEHLRRSRADADALLVQARKAASARSGQILSQAQAQAVQLRERAAADIAQEKQRAIREARAEISAISLAIAEKVVGRQLNAADQQQLIEQFLSDLGDAP